MENRSHEKGVANLWKLPAGLNKVFLKLILTIEIRMRKLSNN
jgi:hypothetical protein